MIPQIRRQKKSTDEVKKEPKKESSAPQDRISFLRRQNTMKVLQRRRPFIISPSMCPLGRLDVESGDHIFIHYPFASKVWNIFKQALNLHFVMPKTMEELYGQWGNGGRGEKGKIFLGIRFMK